MQARRSAVLGLPIVLWLTGWGQQLPMEPAHESGQSITGAFSSRQHLQLVAAEPFAGGRVKLTYRVRESDE